MENLLKELRALVPDWPAESFTTQEPDYEKPIIKEGVVYSTTEKGIPIVSAMDIIYEVDCVEIEITYEGTVINVPCTEQNLRVIKAIYSSSKELLKSEPGCRAFDRLARLSKTKDQPNQRVIDLIFTMPQRVDISKILMAWQAALDALDAATPMPIKEIVIVPMAQELRAWAIANYRGVDMIGELGLEKADEFIFDAPGVNHNGKPTKYTLYKGKVLGYDYACIMTNDSSTDREFLLSVDPAHTTAKDAATLLRLPSDAIVALRGIKRQGEKPICRFEKGFKLDAARGEFQHVPGDLYFSLLEKAS